MARGLNKVMIIGNCGKDPEIKYMPSGNAVVNLSIATSRKWKDKQTGDEKTHTEWHSVVFYGKMAEIVAQYVKKGGQLYVEGELRTRKWQDSNNQDRYTTEIIARDMQLLGSKQGDSGYPASSSAPAATPAHHAPMDDGFDDDIPF